MQAANKQKWKDYTARKNTIELLIFIEYPLKTTVPI
jgi:hypothetical protein